MYDVEPVRVYAQPLNTVNFGLDVLKLSTEYVCVSDCACVSNCVCVRLRVYEHTF